MTLYDVFFAPWVRDKKIFTRSLWVIICCLSGSNGYRGIGFAWRLDIWIWASGLFRARVLLTQSMGDDFPRLHLFITREWVIHQGSFSFFSPPAGERGGIEAIICSFSSHLVLICDPCVFTLGSEEQEQIKEPTNNNQTPFLESFYGSSFSKVVWIKSTIVTDGWTSLAFTLVSPLSLHSHLKWFVDDPNLRERDLFQMPNGFPCTKLIELLGFHFQIGNANKPQ